MVLSGTNPSGSGMTMNRLFLTIVVATMVSPVSSSSFLAPLCARTILSPTTSRDCSKRRICPFHLSSVDKASVPDGHWNTSAAAVTAAGPHVNVTSTHPVVIGRRVAHDVPTGMDDWHQPSSPLLAIPTTTSPRKQCRHLHQQKQQHQQHQLSVLVLLFLGTCASTTIMASMLVQFEWFQTWRYFWPLVGALYMWDALQQEEESSSKCLLPLNNNQPFHRSIRAVMAVCGMGLLIGGAYDATMPVWYTGPNVLTEAGMGQDSTAALLLLTVYGIVVETQEQSVVVNENDQPMEDRVESFQNSVDREELSFQRLLLQILLLAQLYTLGDSSIDAILSDAWSQIT